jgi:hypothetical protein
MLQVEELEPRVVPSRVALTLTAYSVVQRPQNDKFVFRVVAMQVVVTGIRSQSNGTETLIARGTKISSVGGGTRTIAYDISEAFGPGLSQSATILHEHFTSPSLNFTVSASSVELTLAQQTTSLQTLLIVANSQVLVSQTTITTS